MAPAAQPLEAEPWVERIHRLSVEQYHRLIDLGVLSARDRIELLDGLLIEKMSKNPPHVAALTRLSRLVRAVVPGGWIVRTQDPITLASSEPEPDLVIARGDEETYESRHPSAADVGLVVEVAEASLRIDRGIKLREYARAGLSVFWVVNLLDAQVEVYTEPDATAGVYRRVEMKRPGEVLDVRLDRTSVGHIAVAGVLK